MVTAGPDQLLHLECTDDTSLLAQKQIIRYDTAVLARSRLVVLCAAAVLLSCPSSSAPQVVACLGSIDSEIRLAAAKLVSVLAKDAFYSKSIVFPEATLTASVKGGYILYTRMVCCYRSS